MRRTFFSYAGSAASAASEIILSDAVWTRYLTSKMIALRGGVERDHGPCGGGASFLKAIRWRSATTRSTTGPAERDGGALGRGLLSQIR